MDKYNPLYPCWEKDVEYILARQNLNYGMNIWYPLIKDYTPITEIIELDQAEIDLFKRGDDIDPSQYNPVLVAKISQLIDKGYHFVKTSHASSHSFKPMKSIEDFYNEITNARIVMSFKRYNCKHLFLRKWVDMRIECRVYIYNNNIKYMECYLDPGKIFEPSMFEDIKTFINVKIIPLISETYKDITIDVYYDRDNNWNIIEFNSPIWLKAGTYLIDYERNKDRIHESQDIICNYRRDNDIYSINIK